MYQSLINIYVIYTKLTHFIFTKFDIFVATKEKHDTVRLMSQIYCTTDRLRGKLVTEHHHQSVELILWKRWFESRWCWGNDIIFFLKKLPFLVMKSEQGWIKYTYKFFIHLSRVWLCGITIFMVRNEERFVILTCLLSKSNVHYFTIFTETATALQQLNEVYWSKFSKCIFT